VLKLNPRFITAVVKLAEIYSNDLNDQEKALEYAKSARDLSPGDAHISLLVGRIAYKAANYTWAYSLLKQASDVLPRDPEALHALGWAAFSLGKIVEATDCMERVARMAPAGPLAEDARRWLALMQIGGDGSPAKAASEELDRALKTDPNYAPALLAQAVIAANNGDANRAITLYQQVLTRFPEYAPAQKRLAMLYAQVPAELPKAYEFASKARKGLPDDVELTRILAEISYQRKDYVRALEFLSEAARKEPLDANHLYYLGICSLQTKDLDHARAALNQALANGLQDPLASDAKRALQDIKQD
jgi:tetratricopeptide (TPR) repeat protein